MLKPDTIKSTTVAPEIALEILSPIEIDQLVQHTPTGMFELFRRCALAVLNTGSGSDDTREILETYSDFDVKFIRQSRGIRLQLFNAPAHAFVDGVMIRGVREQLFAVLRDVLFVTNEIKQKPRFNLSTSKGITNSVFHILRHADILRIGDEPPLSVCWGGHCISEREYGYTKDVGYELGLRSINIVTGCGPGAMKGPMKGATIGHAKQRTPSRRYIGVTEPGIIAAEAPNPIVNELVILPDIEKRLEAFVRLAHSIIVFPGGVGTAEEILYILGILLNPKNQSLPFPLIFAADKSSGSYFEVIDDFIKDTLGKEAQSKYQVIIGEPADVAKAVIQGIEKVLKHRAAHKDAFYFNWQLHIEADFQMPFDPTHENMAALCLDSSLPTHDLAANLRRAFSGIVSGNVKETGIKRIEEFGPFELSGERSILKPLDNLLRMFVKQKRMTLGSKEYNPCYRIKQSTTR